MVAVAVTTGTGLVPDPAAAAAPPDTGPGAPADPSVSSAEPAPVAEASGLVWSVQPAGGQSSGRAFLVHDVEPGTRVTDAIWVDNLSSEAVTLDIYAADAFNTDDGALDVGTGREPASEVGLWTRPEVAVVTIEPGTRVESPVVIDVPLNATPGDHAGGIVASMITRRVDESGAAVELETRVGVRVYLRVDGELAPSLTVTDMRMDWSVGLDPTDGSLTVAYTVRNDGNVRLGAEQYLEVLGPFDWLLGQPELAVLDEILPGSEVRQEVSLSGLPAAVRAKVDVTLLPFDTSGSLPTAAEPVTITSSVWAVPWTLLALLAIVVAVVAEWRRRGTRRAGGGATDPGAADAATSDTAGTAEVDGGDLTPANGVAEAAALARTEGGGP
ncbi:MAG: DUF916 domain-containing protein [Desertimonas sp.]